MAENRTGDGFAGRELGLRAFYRCESLSWMLPVRMVRNLLHVVVDKECDDPGPHVADAFVRRS